MTQMKHCTHNADLAHSPQHAHNELLKEAFKDVRNYREPVKTCWVKRKSVKYSQFCVKWKTVRICLSPYLSIHGYLIFQLIAFFLMSILINIRISQLLYEPFAAFWLADDSHPLPPIGQIERTLFEDTVKTLNTYYAEAEKIGGQSYIEGCLACLTVYLIFLCIETRYEKVFQLAATKT